MITKWRTQSGAEYSDLREVPCWIIANGLLVHEGEWIGEDHPQIKSEIQRRGRDVYKDHGYGEFHLGAPVIGCDHSTN